jgi:hypothetical protein
MTLKIVGAGFGRTGTYSLKLALEQLGLGPCHHMYEVRENPDQPAVWQALARGEAPDWDAVFAGYEACVDWPATRFWREIAAYYGEAKVVLTVRPAEAWIESIHATIYPSMRDWAQQEPGTMREARKMAHDLVVEQTFGGRLDDRDHAMAVFRAHNEEVQSTIAPERLLTYEATQGWEPLCRFLDVPVPDTPFPYRNTTEEFRNRPKPANLD